jgi:hypothetical protein
MNVILATSGSDGARWLRKVDTAKILIMTEIAGMVADGRATLTTLACGRVELRLETGQVFHLGVRTITRIL